MKNLVLTHWTRHWLAGMITWLGVWHGADACARPLEVWISSFQDKVYYERMIQLYKSKVDKSFEANVHAYGFQEMPDKLAVAIRTGTNPPDVVQLDEVLFGLYLAGEVPFVDLTERIKGAGLDKDILEARMGLFSYRGKTFGLPQSVSAMVLYYRADMFEKHGITPAHLATWEDFVREGERLMDKNQPMMPLDPTYFEVFLRQRGTDLFDESGAAFPDTAVAVDTLNWMRGLYEKRIAILPERSSIFDPVFFSSSVLQGEVMCIVGADWFGLDMLQQFTPDLKGKWGVMALPAWKRKDGGLGPRTSTFAGQGLLIYKGSAEIESSWRFIEWVMKDPDANAERFLKGNSFPAYKPAWKDERLLGEWAFFHDQAFGRLLVELAPEIPKVVVHPRRPQAVFMFQESFFTAFMYGQMTAEETIQKMKAELAKP